MSYNFNEIEAKWQKYWKENKTFQAENPSENGNPEKDPFYVLDMFPYPSGAGLHVGHPLGYIAGDIIARYKRHKGFNVLHPMGYDSFGLPAEQYAIQTGQHPAITTKENIKRYRQQLDQIGFSFDWSREVRTSNPEYYRWTQWIFLQLFESWYDNKEDKAKPIFELVEMFEKHGNIEVDAHSDQEKDFSAEEWSEFSKEEKSKILLKYRLAYLAETEVNWCPQLGTVLANDEIVNGVSERGGYPVERKKMKQWNMRITAYAERLLKGLEKLDWTDSLKETQRNWIGKSKGALINFKVLSEADMKSGKYDLEEKPFLDDTRNPTNDHLYKKAKECKENPTDAEAILWSHLKEMKFLFKQQFIINDFIVNFICPKKKLIVEIEEKGYKVSEDYAEKRTKILNNKGYQVINFKHDEVVQETEEVLKKIEACLLKDNSHKNIIETFTTRPDTIFGVSFLTLAPEHEMVLKITTSKHKKEVKNYIEETKKRSERERMADTKSVSGVFTGAYAEHPFTKKPIPIWISDYVLPDYGTGSVMAVPTGDQRDYDFAKHFNISIKNIFEDVDISKGAHTEKGDAKLINSDFLNGMYYGEAMKTVIGKLGANGLGESQVNYRLRDAVFSRQRYWGEPFPIYYKNGIPHAIPEEHLPLELPEIEKYLPTQDGAPPLGRADEWYWDEVNEQVVTNNHSSQLQKNIYKLELNTMPGWAGSSWYFFRYMEITKRATTFASQEALDYWKNVNLYIGGSEHGTGHLLYARFWTKFLYDMGLSPVKEPFQKLINQGMILGESAFAHRLKNSNTFISANKIEQQETHPIHVDVSFVNTDNELNIEQFKSWRKDFEEAEFITEDSGVFRVTREVEKMSKSKFNVVNPDDICEEYGADSLRLYEMFLGPLNQEKPWSTAGLSGVHNFLKKLWNLYHDHATGNWIVTDEKASKASLKTLHQTIEKVTQNIEAFSFNTAVSRFMICVNELHKQKCRSKEVLEPLAVLIAPYAPHIAEELWERLGRSKSISTAAYPKYNPEMVKESSKTYPISFNGKKRYTLDLPLDLNKDEITEIVMKDERTEKQLQGRKPKRVIVVPGKIVNIVG